MKLTSWNLRGLNSPGKLRIIKNMIKMEQPQICCLQETKCNSSTLGNILLRAWLGSQLVAVDASGASGGLAIAWNAQALTLSDFHASHHIIQTTFHIIGTNIHGHLTNVYFPQEAGNKITLLNTIEALNFNRIHPLWIIGGDFNMITKLEEKQGCRAKLEQENGHFKEFIQNNSLIDLQFCNGTHTWSNRRIGKHQIASKLDRFLISDNAVHLGGDIAAAVFPYSGSDHWPISLQWQRLGNATKRPFRFEDFWLTHLTFKDFIRSTWNTFQSLEGSKMFQFQQKLKHLKSQIKRWNQETFGNIFQAQQDLNKEMKELQQQIITGGHNERTLEQEQRIRNQLEERRKQEEILWKQKSRIRWLKEGERNTKFFHRTTVQRRMHNNISFIQKQGGERVEKHDEIEQEFLRHLRQVHQEPLIDRRPAIEKITQNVPKIITEEHNELLLSPILPQEVDAAMNQLKEGKAPGSDGFTTTFFLSFRELIKDEVWQVVEESRTLHWLLPSLNSTFIALIPKEERTNTPDKFRPIALCNVIYKVIFKVIANRLKPLLPLLISPKQSGYVEGRQILDGIILTHEIIHSLKHSKQTGMILKLDLSKAFDKLSWTYIQKMLNAFGFSPMWEASMFKSLLNDFSEASGTSINKAKSQIFFFHTPPVVQHAIACILGFSIDSLPSKYLGAPLIDSAIKHSTWRILIEKLESRLNLWTHKTLNIASRLVLIKAVLQAMPLYVFSILAAPKWVIKRIRDLQHNFLWGTIGTNRKWALVKWSTACMAKEKGGIGLRDPNHSNAIMCAKIWWQWLSSPNKPWAAIWTAKYANHRPQEELIRFTPNAKGSYGMQPNNTSC
eukprot:PITA_11111